MCVSPRQRDRESHNHSVEVGGFGKLTRAVGEDHAVIQAVFSDKYFAYMTLFNPLSQPSRQDYCPHFRVEETEA